AAEHINAKIAQTVIGVNVFEQTNIDHLLIDADGTNNKINLGANAMLGVSIAVAKTAAKALGLPLYSYLGGINAKQMPVPMMNILNGGAHVDNTLDIQEFMIMPIGAPSFQEGLRMCAEIYQTLKALLKKHNLSTAVGDEGGFAPDLPNAKEALSFIAEATTKAGYVLGKEIAIALDVAASELYEKGFKKYVFHGEGKMQGHQVIRSTEEMIDYYEELVSNYPIVSIEDPLDEEDWEGWELLTTRMGQDIQLVGDDLFVTNIKRLKMGIQKGVANAILIKANQIGTLTEAVDAIEMAKEAGYQTIISHRSGETEDPFIADMAVAFRAGQIKCGAPCRGERTAKYNQLIRIEERLGDVAKYENPFQI
ncbi:MAG: phosphopyruvate hydratase, partial [Lachnospiraceae bacterium]